MQLFVVCLPERLYDLKKVTVVDCVVLLYVDICARFCGTSASFDDSRTAQCPYETTVHNAIIGRQGRIILVLANLI